MIHKLKSIERSTDQSKVNKKTERDDDTYIFDFVLKVVSVVTVFHKEDELCFALCVVIKLNDVLMLELRMYCALSTCVSVLRLTHEFVLHDGFSYHSL